MRRGKEFLLRAEIMERRIDAALRKVELLKSLTQRITAKLDHEQVSHSRNVSANEDAIIQLMEAEEQLKQLCAEYGVVVSEIMAALASLENRDDERLLSDVFLKHQPLEQIAAREHVTKSCVYKRCDRALDALERILIC
ncbi:MAG: hypothetical protein ACI4CT_08050 [Lachnospiraceae bacterium]